MSAALVPRGAAAVVLLLFRSWLFSLHPEQAFGVVLRPPRPCRSIGGVRHRSGGGVPRTTTRICAAPTPDGTGGPEDPEELEGRPQPLRPADRGGSGSSDRVDEDPAPPFATGAALASLRADLESLRENLGWARATGDAARVRDLAAAIAAGERRDPDLAYGAALRALADSGAAGTGGRPVEAAAVRAWQREARRARAALPQFRLEGLWVGSYGAPGDQLINVTYSGDTLIASKATGDHHVPRGQVSFTVDLSPVAPDHKPLAPLRIAVERADAGRGDGVVRVPRFAGRGQVAGPGFADPTYVEGQLVLFEHHLSFVWLPLRHHVLFRRPSPWEVLALLRDPLAAEDARDNRRRHLERCLRLDPDTAAAAAATRAFEDDPGAAPSADGPLSFRRISLQRELEARAEPAAAGDDVTAAGPSGAARFPLWHVWRYWDSLRRRSEPNLGGTDRPRDDDAEPEPRAFYEGEGI